MAELLKFLDRLLARIDQAPINTAVALVIVLIATTLIIRIWRAMGAPQPPPLPPQPAPLEQQHPWIGLHILRQSDQLEALRDDMRDLKDLVAENGRTIAEAVAIVKARRRHRPHRRK